MLTKLNTGAVAIALFCACIFSCKKEKVQTTPAETKPMCGYANQIRSFLVSKCAINGCHSKAATFGDFSTYGDLKKRIDNGRFNQMVFELKVMPPATAVQLSSEETELLKCWINSGAPDN